MQSVAGVLLAITHVAGYWKTDKGFKLETNEGEYPTWSGQALIHSGFSLEYKYIIVRNGEVIWETGPVNRTLKTAFETMIVDDGNFNGLRIGVQTAPIRQVSGARLTVREILQVNAGNALKVYVRALSHSGQCHAM